MNKKFNVVNAKDLMENGVLVPEYIMNPIITKLEKVVLSSEAKSGKSTMLLQLIEALINGTEFFGYVPTKPCRVFYVNAEIPEWRVYERFKLTNFKYNENLFINVFPNHYALNEKKDLFSNKTKIYDIDYLKNEIEKCMPIDVLVLDPLSNFFCGEENSSENMKLFCATIDQLILDYQLCVFISHHTRKAPATQQDVSVSPFQTMRGSSALAGWYSLGLHMSPKTNSARTLFFDCRNSDKPLDVTFVYDIITKRYINITPETGSFELIKQIILDSNHPINMSELYDLSREKYNLETRQKYLSTQKQEFSHIINNLIDTKKLKLVNNKIFPIDLL